MINKMKFKFMSLTLIVSLLTACSSSGNQEQIRTGGMVQALSAQAESTVVGLSETATALVEESLENSPSVSVEMSEPEKDGLPLVTESTSALLGSTDINNVTAAWQSANETVAVQTQPQERVTSAQVQPSTKAVTVPQPPSTKAAAVQTPQPSTKAAAVTPPATKAPVWHEPVYNTVPVYVIDKEAWTEEVKTEKQVPVYSFVDYIVCTCGFETTDIYVYENHADIHMDNNEPSAYKVETRKEIAGYKIEYDISYVNHPAEGHYENKQVLVSEGYWE